MPSSHPINDTLALLGRRWTLRVLWELRDGPAATFEELRTACGGISSSVLATRLKELRAADVLEPAGFSLTPRGEELATILLALNAWSTDTNVQKRLAELHVG